MPHGGSLPRETTWSLHTHSRSTGQTSAPLSASRRRPCHGRRLDEAVGSVNLTHLHLSAACVHFPPLGAPYPEPCSAGRQHGDCCRRPAAAMGQTNSRNQARFGGPTTSRPSPPSAPSPHPAHVLYASARADALREVGATTDASVPADDYVEEEVRCLQRPDVSRCPDRVSPPPPTSLLAPCSLPTTSARTARSGSSCRAELHSTLPTTQMWCALLPTSLHFWSHQELSHPRLFSNLSQPEFSFVSTSHDRSVHLLPHFTNSLADMAGLLTHPSTGSLSLSLSPHQGRVAGRD